MGFLFQCKKKTKTIGLVWWKKVEKYRFKMVLTNLTKCKTTTGNAIRRTMPNLDLPSSEQGLIQSHGCPHGLFVCKLNVGKPVGGEKTRFSKASGSAKTTRRAERLSLRRSERVHPTARRWLVVQILLQPAQSIVSLGETLQPTLPSTNGNEHFGGLWLHM